MSLDTILVCLIYHFKIDFSTSIIKMVSKDISASARE